jgi:hypothetical protein
MIGRLHHVVLDCPDPAGRAFYLLHFAGGCRSPTVTNLPTAGS